MGHRTRRHKRQRRRTHTRQRGGNLPQLKSGAIVWPPNEGCADAPVPVTFEVGETFDRFGPPSGSYVSPSGDSIQRFATLLGISAPQPSAYSYTNRALPYAGVTNAGVSENSLRRSIYQKVYKEDLMRDEADYYVYRVLTENAVNGSACVAAPVFDTSGGAIQVKLSKPISELLQMGAIDQLPIQKIPGYFRENGMIEK